MPDRLGQDTSAGITIDFRPLVALMQPVTTQAHPVPPVMNLLLCCNAGYLQHLFVTLTSIAEQKTRYAYNVVVVVQSGDVTAFDVLARLVRIGVKIAPGRDKKRPVFACALYWPVA